MKKIVLFVLVIVSFASCKKKYNCRCSTTVLFNNSQGYYLSKNSPMSEKMSEKQAKAVCTQEAKNLDVTYENLITNNGNMSANGITAASICSID